MFTAKYHIATILGIFVALGTGILIGGTLGQGWMHQTENQLVEILTHKYREQLTVNQNLLSRVQQLETVTRTTHAGLAGTRLLWMGRDKPQPGEAVHTVFETAGIVWVDDRPDLIIVTDRALSEQWKESIRSGGQSGPSPRIIAVEAEASFQSDKVEDASHLLAFIRKMMEDPSYETARIYHYSGVE